MSTACRQFRTTKMIGSHKLLIVQGSATVAEGRQGGQEVTPPNNLIVVLLRHYIGVIASLIIRHCERVNGKAPAMQRNLP
jgi:hypothetical protein